MPYRDLAQNNKAYIVVHAVQRRENGMMRPTKIVGKVHEFNTGRYYGKDRQPITWAVVELEGGGRGVAFADSARGIDGIIPLLIGNLDLVTDEWVLRAYDDFHFHPGWTQASQMLRETRTV